MLLCQAGADLVLAQMAQESSKCRLHHICNTLSERRDSCTGSSRSLDCAVNHTLMVAIVDNQLYFRAHS